MYMLTVCCHHVHLHQHCKRVCLQVHALAINVNGPLLVQEVKDLQSNSNSKTTISPPFLCAPVHGRMSKRLASRDSRVLMPGSMLA
jgi:hypothetical protein